ncbi:MAG: OmpA family protein [bacterium]
MKHPALIIAFTALLSGCATGKVDVKIVGEKISFLDKVRFKYNQAEIKRESFPLLDEIARLLKERPEIKRLEIAGYTDDAGSSDYNRKLSQSRAAAVKQYLIDKGIARKRLRSAGYGKKNPIASNKTRAGRDRNRRVEFIIVR